eukprot:Rhum_TRINITY_DN7340_c0_g1::Rhum_TRINITY_DN7340_c0_g1_i1::g.22689::m.22689
MVTQNGNLGVGLVEVHHLLRLRQLGVDRLLLEDLVKEERCVVGTEHLCTQSRHELLEVRVQVRRLHLVEHLVLGQRAAVLAHQKLLHQVVDRLRDLDVVVVPDRVLTQEVEVQEELFVLRERRDVLGTQRAAPDGVRLILTLVTTHTQGKLVDEVHGNAHLQPLHVLALEAGLVVVTNLLDNVLQTPRHLELLLVLPLLHRTRLVELRVLHVTRVAVVPLCQPRHRVVADHSAPLASSRRRWRLLHVLAVDGDVLRVRARLQAAHLRVKPTPAEQAGRLDHRVGDLLLAAVPHDELVRGLLLVRLQPLFLLLRCGHRLLLRLLLLVVRPDLVEVAQRQLDDLFALRTLVQDGLPRREEVAAEHGLLVVVGLAHHGEHRRHLLLRLRHHELLPLVRDRLVVPHVRRREHRSVVRQRAPLDAAVVLSEVLVVPPVLLLRLRVRVGGRRLALLRAGLRGRGLLRRRLLRRLLRRRDDVVGVVVHHLPLPGRHRELLQRNASGPNEVQIL